MTKEGAGVGSTLVSVLKSPAVIGAGGGALGGAGVGYARAAGEPPGKRLKSTLSGARWGSLIGGLGGGIISAGQLGRAIEAAKSGQSLTPLAEAAAAKNVLTDMLKQRAVRPEAVDDVVKVIQGLEKDIAGYKPAI